MSTPTLSEELNLALLRCAEEKIHLIGQMQGGYGLMGVDLAADRFSYLSDNVAELTGVSAVDLLWNVKPSEWITRQQLEMLWGKAVSNVGRGARLMEVRLPGRDVQLAWIHASDGHLMIEFSPAQDEVADGSAWAWESEMLDSLTRIESQTDLDLKLLTVVDEVAKLGSFDRVMVYRFHEDDSGEVVAEKVRCDWEPYLGLRYPASDIPPQARQLFLRNDVRMIRDVNAPPVMILGSPELSAATPDLSLARFRQPSPVHLEYLRNMGVAASFVSAILVHDQLWGLISCHHGKPLELSSPQQVQLGALTRHVSCNLSAMASESQLRNELDCARISSKLIQCIAVTDDWTSVLMSMAEEICELLGADGLSLRFGATRQSFGLVPPEEAGDGFISLGIDQGGGLSFSSTRETNLAAYDYLPEEIGGFLVIPLSFFQDDALVFFRKEQTRDVLWAGNPVKEIDRSGEAIRLQPRSSFSAWKESLEGTCKAWSAADLKLASSIRTTLSDIVITAHYFRQSLESPSTVRFRLAHEMDSEPVIIANENGIVVYENTAAISDPFLKNLQSLDLITKRVSAEQIAEVAKSFHSLVHEGEEIALLIRPIDGSPRRLEGKSLVENDQVMGYSIRILKG